MTSNHTKPPSDAAYEDLYTKAEQSYLEWLEGSLDEERSSWLVNTLLQEPSIRHQLQKISPCTLACLSSKRERIEILNASRPRRKSSSNRRGKCPTARSASCSGFG